MVLNYDLVKKTETPFFFRNGDYNLFGVLHEPEADDFSLQPATSSLGRLGFVFCHAFAEEKLISQRVMVNLARRLTREGIFCLRFDYMGHGDSDGNFEDSTIETRLSDIQCAIDTLKNQTGVERIGLLGLRFGATLAALACASAPIADPLVLISPVVHGKAYIARCLRSNLTTQMAVHKRIVKDRNALVKDLLAGLTVNIDGYLLTNTLFQQIETINLPTELCIAPSYVLIIQVSNKEKQPIQEGINRLYIKYKAIGSVVELSNVRGDYFWTDNRIYDPHARKIQEAIVNWLFKVHFE